MRSPFYQRLDELAPLCLKQAKYIINSLVRFFELRIGLLLRDGQLLQYLSDFLYCCIGHGTFFFFLTKIR